MLGQEFIITDADGFTREYYKNELGVNLPPPLSRPKIIRKDIGAQYATGMGSALPLMKDHFGTRSTDYLTLKEGLDKTKLFLENDGKILRFECCEVFTRDPPFFPELQMKAISLGYYNLVASADVKTFAIAFYLSTGNLELTIQKLRPTSPLKKELESSSDEPKLILRKSKVPLNWKEAQRGLPPKYYGPNDLNCGTVIDIYGRYFLLLSCDSFTSNFYTNLGKHMNEVMLMHEDKPTVTHEIPQRGKLRDGILSCLYYPHHHTYHYHNHTYHHHTSSSYLLSSYIIILIIDDIIDDITDVLSLLTTSISMTSTLHHPYSCLSIYIFIYLSLYFMSTYTR